MMKAQAKETRAPREARLKGNVPVIWYTTYTEVVLYAFSRLHIPDSGRNRPRTSIEMPTGVNSSA